MYDQNTQKIINNGGSVFFAQEIAFDQNSIKLNTGESMQLEANIKPEEAFDRTIIWISSDPSVISVDLSGNATANAVGTAKVIATCDYGKASCQMTVEKGTPKLQIDSALDLSLKDKKVPLNWVISKGAGKVRLETEDSEVASVSHNALTVHNTGKTYIRIRSEESKDYYSVNMRIPITVYRDEVPAVSFAKTSNVSNGVLLSWDPIKQAKGYYIYRQENVDARIKIADVKQEVSLKEPFQLLDDTVESGHMYRYTLQYYTESFISKKNDSEKQIMFLPAPNDPELVNTNSGFSLKWQPVSLAEGYQIFRRKAGGMYKCIASLDSKEIIHKDIQQKQSYCVYEDKTPKLGEEYDYVIRAVNGSYVGALTKEALNGVFLKSPVISRLANGTGYIRLTWKQVDYSDCYQIYRKTDNSEWILLQETTETSIADKDVENISLYSYRVRGVKNEKPGPWQAGEKKIWYIDTPHLLMTRSESDGLGVYWLPVEGAIRYIIIRKTKGTNWERIGFANGNENSHYIDKNAEKGVEYSYTIRAVYADSTSQYDLKGIKGTYNG